MVVPMNPCRRRGGLWWRMDVGSGWRRKPGGREKIKEGGEEMQGREKGRGEGVVGFFRNQKPALAVRQLEFFKNQKRGVRSAPTIGIF